MSNTLDEQQMSEMNPEVPACGARTRAGHPCKNPAMPNGRCRMHGGKSTGPKDLSKHTHNKHALKTGEYELIQFIDEDEREYLNFIRTKDSTLEIINNQLDIYALRIRRMMKRIKEVMDGDDFSITERQQTVGTVNSKSQNSTTTNEKHKDQRVMELEEALTRIQDKRNKAIEMKQKILEAEGSDEMPDIAPYIEALKGQQANIDWSVINGETES